MAQRSSSSSIMNHQTLLAISEPHPHDVLKGKGRKTNAHPGNKNFRRLVKAWQKDYVLAAKEERPFYAKYIIREIEFMNPPGRFLVMNEKTSMWHVMSKKATEVKTRQALREGAPRILRDLDQDSASSAGVRSSTGVGRTIAPFPTTNTVQAAIPTTNTVVQEIPTIHANGNFLRDFRTEELQVSIPAISATGNFLRDFRTEELTTAETSYSSSLSNDGTNPPTHQISDAAQYPCMVFPPENQYVVMRRPASAVSSQSSSVMSSDYSFPNVSSSPHCDVDHESNMFPHFMRQANISSARVYHPNGLLQGSSNLQHPMNVNSNRVNPTSAQDYHPLPYDAVRGSISSFPSDTTALMIPSYYDVNEQEQELPPAVAANPPPYRTRSAPAAMSRAGPYYQSSFRTREESFSPISTNAAIAPATVGDTSEQQNNSYEEEARNMKKCLLSSAHQTGYEVSSSRGDLDHQLLELDWRTSNETQQLSNSQQQQPSSLGANVNAEEEGQSSHICHDFNHITIYRL